MRKHCPVCSRKVKVNMDGKLRKHKRELEPGKLWMSWCPNQSPNR